MNIIFLSHDSTNPWKGVCIPLYLFTLQKATIFVHVIFKMHLQRFSTVKDIYDILLRKNFYLYSERN